MFQQQSAAVESHEEFMSRNKIMLGRKRQAPSTIAAQDAKAHSLFQQGLALHQQGQLMQAKAIYEQVLVCQPNHAQALHLLGVIAAISKNFSLAENLIGKAIALKPDYITAIYNYGNVLLELKRFDEALESYDKFITVHPQDVEVFSMRGYALKGLGRLDESLLSYKKAMAIQPEYEFLLGNQLHMQMYLCEWTALPEQLVMLETALSHARKVTLPFPLIGLLDSPALQLKAAQLYAEVKHPASTELGAFSLRAPHQKIRIGYYSADFHSHATSALMAELFEVHDKDQFEFYGFSFGPETHDDMRARVKAGLGQFFDVRTKSDREIAQLSRELGIDIAVDLKGYTQDARTGIFAYRCAPIQVNYLGYPGTMGASYFDYIIADAVLIPVQSQSCYSEKVVYLPHSYQVNDAKREISEKVFTRAELDLPEDAFVFCCFNSPFKILPTTFDVWMRILQTVQGSVLWLLEGHPTAVTNLRKEAQARGIDPSRLVFAKRMSLADHLARHRAADLFVDTWPCNAHTTASDALWAGLPVLTCIGQSFAGRVAASLLRAMDLNVCVTQTFQEYEAKAVELAQSPAKLAQLKQWLNQQRQTSSLFDARQFASHLEEAYRQMHERYRRGEKPMHMTVKA